MEEGVSGQEGKTANDKDKYKDKDNHKDKDKNTEKDKDCDDETTMPDCRKGILQIEGRAPRLGNHLHSPPLYYVNQYNDVLHQSTRFYSEFTLQRSVLVHYLSDMYT